MEKFVPVFGLFAILFLGMISPTLAQNYDEWDEKYRHLESDFENKRQHLEQYYQEKYQQLEEQYTQHKMEIYEKVENNPEISDSEMDAMFQDLISRYEQKRSDLESSMMQDFEELERMFQHELQEFDKQRNQYYENSDYDSTEPHLNDPDWQNIEPLAQQIMDAIPLEKIQHLWETGQIDELIELIVSETDLSYEEAKRVVMFFEKYEARYADGTYNNYDSFEYDEQYQELYPPIPPEVVTTYDDQKIQQLEQKISELERENQILRETISQLEEKITQINAVLMEQVKFIYEWVQSQ